MIRTTTPGLAFLFLLPMVLFGGCDGLTIDIPGGWLSLGGLNTVTLELYNDTDFDVDPMIVFDDDSGFWAGLVPSEELATGWLAPGEVLTYNFDCDELGLILSDEAEQVVGPFVYSAYPTRTLERDDEYDCGDRIEFQFIGTADTFGVIVAVNGRVID